MQTQRIAVRLPKELVQAIDQMAAEYFESRSDFIRMAILLRLKRQSLVEQPQDNSILEALLASE